MRKAVIDLGSNSIKMAIGEQVEGNIIIIEFLKNIIPIGNTSFSKGNIPQAIINQAVDILKKYKIKLKEYDIDEAKVVATTAIREAYNKDIFIDQIQRQTGFKIQILEVGDIVFYIDSYISSKLNNFPIKTENILLAELGTGSLDVSGLQKGALFFQTGFPLGTYKISWLLEKLDGSFKENQEAVEEYINNEFRYLQKNIKPIEIDDIILVDENYSLYINKFIKSKANKKNFFRYTKKEIESLSDKLNLKTYEEFSDTYKIPNEIAKTFPAYAVLLKNFSSLIKKEHIHILNIPLSETILTYEFNEDKPLTKQLDYIHIINTSKFLLQKFNQDKNHLEHVEYLSSILFESLKKILGLNDRYKIYLTIASYFHDLGIFISERAHHKHSEYLIQAINLLRMKPNDKKIIACISRYHRKASPKDSHPLYGSLNSTEKLIVQKLSSLLRMANSLDCSHTQKIKQIDIQGVENSSVNFKIKCSKNYLLEKSEFLVQKTFFEKLTGISINLV